MSDVVRQLIDLVMTRPLTTVGCAIAAILYAQLMTGPRVR